MPWASKCVAPTVANFENEILFLIFLRGGSVIFCSARNLHGSVTLWVAQIDMKWSGCSFFILRLLNIRRIELCRVGDRNHKCELNEVLGCTSFNWTPRSVYCYWPRGRNHHSVSVFHSYVYYLSFFLYILQAFPVNLISYPYIVSLQLQRVQLSKSGPANCVSRH